MSDSTSVAQAVVIEQSRHIQNNLLTSVIGGFLIACVLVLIFRPVVPNRELLTWLGVNVLLAVWRLAMRAHFLRAAPTYENARTGMRYALLGTLGSGLQWAASTAFMMPEGNVLYQVLLVFAISMMDVAAMFSFGVHLPTFLGFFVPSMCCTIIALVAKGDALHFGLAVAIAIFMVVALRFVMAFQRIFARALELRFENAALVEELTIEKEVAEQANLAKSRFLAAASHDLRQPMHALNLYLGTLAGLALPENAQSVVGHVQQCADTMDGLFRGLLDISRLDAGAIKPEAASFPVAGLLERIRVEFEPQARARGLKLSVVASRARVRSDAALVERVLRNFTVNAVRYTEAGGIVIGCRRAGSSLRIAVYDTGPGIAPEHQKAIFEEFFQVANPNRDRSRGIGLGLAIVERLARLLEAPLTVRSRVGHGSMFAIDLPIDLPLTQRTRVAAPAARTSAGEVLLEGAQVVVIDDELPILDAMRGLLEQWGRGS